MPSVHRKILIVAPSWVGDMVMAQSLLIALKEQNPNVIIDVLAPAWSQALTQRMPEVRKAIVSPFQHGEFNWRARYDLALSIRQENYDQAIVLPNSFKSALIPFLAKIKQRTGWRGEMRWGLLNDLRFLDKKKYPLMVERFVALAFPKDSSLPDKLPKPHLISHTNHEVLLKKLGISIDHSKPLLIMCPGAEFGASKRWPEEYFAEVAQRKVKEGWAVWLLGSKNDQVVTKEIKKIEPACVDLAGLTTLDEAIDLMSLATVVLSNDSGLMHVASALQKPLIALYGSTSKQFTPPLSDGAITLSLALPCQPCFERVCPLQHFRCMRDLKPEQVLQTLNEMKENARINS